MRRYRAFAALLCAVAASCSGNGVQDITGTPPASQIKFFNFGVNAPSVNFWADTVKLTAITSTKVDTVSTLGTAYGQAAAGGYYTGIKPGQYTISGKITATTDQGLAIASTPATLDAGKMYSYYLSGIYNTTTKTVDAFILEDAFPTKIDWANAQVRFVNAISNANPMILYAKTDSTTVESAVGAAVAYKAGGTFVTLPPGAYDLNTRYVGSNTNVVSKAAVSLVGGHVYTVTARGDITASSGTGKPALDVTANQ